VLHKNDVCLFGVSAPRNVQLFAFRKLDRKQIEDRDSLRLCFHQSSWKSSFSIILIDFRTTDGHFTGGNFDNNSTSTYHDIPFFNPSVGQNIIANTVVVNCVHPVITVVSISGRWAIQKVTEQLILHVDQLAQLLLGGPQTKTTGRAQCKHHKWEHRSCITHHYFYYIMFSIYDVRG
jgi:hypothetical protein